MHGLGHIRNNVLERYSAYRLAGVHENIFHIAVTLDTSHLLSGWLKEVALSNIHRFFLIFFSND